MPDSVDPSKLTTRLAVGEAKNQSYDCRIPENSKTRYSGMGAEGRGY